MKKLLQLMQAIKTPDDLGKLNETLISLNVIPRTEFKVTGDRDITDGNGTVWQNVTVFCDLTLKDTESEESVTTVVFGSGIDKQGDAVILAQEAAREAAWMTILNLSAEIKVVREPVPEVIVETPESKLIAKVKALWAVKWAPEQLPGWIEARFKRPLEQLNVVELEVVAKELEEYGRQK